jgi:hypothetical protein
MKDIEIQCELDEAMTVRNLPLELQGFMESYMLVVPGPGATENSMEVVNAAQEISAS